MMKTGTTGKTHAGVTAEQFETAMAHYADATLREVAINRLIDQEMDELNEKYKDERACLVQTRDTSFGIVQAYCVDNKATLFNRRRSIGTVHGVAGFRLGTPRLRTMKGKSWDKIVMGLKERLPAYVRTTDEPAKDLLLADRNKEHVAPVLAELGLQVVQDELFYIEAKKAA
jgi:phage host-nuclease inhibitor protein Gam